MLNENEMNVLKNKDFLLTKANVLEKLKNVLQDTHLALQHYLYRQQHIILNKDIDQKSGKLSKGENYKQLPYLVLDFPKKFNGEDIFTFRTMMWWGNYFSFTLHLQGNALEVVREKICRNMAILQKNEVYISVNESPWEYDYSTENYILIDELSVDELQQLIVKKPFLKLSRKLGLDQYERCHSFAVLTLDLYFQTMK
jgi:hypothetical protein